MLKQIKQYFKKYNDMAKTVDYLTNHMNNHLMCIHKNNTHGDAFAMFGREQLRFLVSSRISLNTKQADLVINLAIKRVIANAKASFMVTHNAIYMAVL